MKLPVPRPDKAYHAIYGQVIFMAAASLGVMLGQRPYAIAFGLLATVLFAIGKEISDQLANERAAEAGLVEPHEVSRADAAWTIGGGAWLAIVLKVLG